MLPSSQYFKLNNKIFCFAWGHLRRTNKTTFCSLRQEQDTKTLLWKKTTTLFQINFEGTLIYILAQMKVFSDPEVVVSV